MSGKLQQIAVFERPLLSRPSVNGGEMGNGDVDVDMMDVDEPRNGVEQQQQQQQQQESEQADMNQGDGGAGTEVLKFTELIQDLRTVYPEQQMRDISTSYCFICLLHLANEKGLVLEGDVSGQGDMQEILVSKDKSVGEGYEGE
jgi:hypothetical protein